MGVELIRVDERLLHGQVVVGWGQALDLSRYLVVDDEIAGSNWEQELWSAGVPEGVEVAFVTLDEIAPVWERLVSSPDPAAVLTRDPATMRGIAEIGLLRDRTVNVGVVHDRDGRRKATDSVYLSGSDLEDLWAIETEGARVEARDLPGSRAVPLGELADAASVG